MNKMKKLLSVVLAIIMALSCMSVMASAAKANYKSVADLEGLNAYSPYGQVTRLSSDERASIVLDFLDNTLAGLNIKMDPIDLLGIININIDLTSVDALSDTIQNLKEVLNTVSGIPILGGIAMGLLGTIQYINLDSWDNPKRSGEQLAIFSELLELLSNNTEAIERILSSGELDLGLVSNFLGSVDLSVVTDVIGNIPGLIKGLIFPLIERWDDTLETIQKYDNNIDNASASVEEIVNFRVKKLFTDDMSNTTVKYNEAGTMTSEHTKMPIRTTAPSTTTVQSAASTPRMVYYVTGTTPGSVMTIYHLVDKAEEKALAKDTDSSNDQKAYTYFEQENKFYLEEEVAGNGIYVWKEKNDKGEVLSTLKWYNDNSPLLPGVSGDDIDLRTMSAGELLYKFIPVVFEQMAPVVLNGSVKKILAEFFGAQFTYVGKAGLEADEAVAALGTDDIFVGEQGEYVFEWSDYAIINGVHYYRYLDDLYVADLSATNNYFDIINWNYKIDDNFMNEFIPASDDNASDRLLLHFNDFLVKVAETVTVKSVLTEDSYVQPDGTKFTAQWTRPDFASGNANVVDNLKAAAQAVISLAPQHIFGSDYETNERCYYNLMMSENEDTILTGIAAHLVDMIMPSMTLPGASKLEESNATVGTILAAVIREFAAQLIPEYNYDALIYADFGTTTTDPDKTFINPETAGLVTTGDTVADYWFDVILTMGINIGFEYIRAFADMGEDTTEWTSMVSETGYDPDGKTYAAGTTQATLNAQWEGMLDYVIDWALATDKEWTWQMANLVEVDGLTIDLATAQDPFVKLDKILFGIIPFDEILKIEPAEGQTRFEHFLRDDLILGIVNLNWDHLINTIQFPTEGTSNYFRSGNVLDQLAAILKRIVNGIFDKVGGGTYQFIPSSVTDFDSLATKAGITNLAVGLVGKLKTAYDNGLIHTALPIINMFLGWNTDPQKMADPQVWTTFRDNNDYAYQWTGNGVYPQMDAENTLIHVQNNSSGMLETHRGSSITDHAYDINIKGVTSDATVNTLTFTVVDNVLSPYEQTTIKVGGTYKGEEAVTVVITYDYVGKDGQPVGGTQYKAVTFFISDKFEDAQVITPESAKADNTYTAAYNTYIFTEDIYNTIVNYESAVYYNSGNSLWESTSKVNGYQAPAQVLVDDKGDSCANNDVYGDAPYPDDDEHAASGYFRFRTQAESGWETISSQGSASADIGQFYTENGKAADYDYPLGTYAWPKVVVQYGSSQKVFEHTFIHYDNYDIDVMWADFKDKNITVNDVNSADPAAVEAYNAYNTALKEVCRLATYPMMTASNGNATSDYVDVIMPQIQPAMTNLEEKYKTLEEYLADAQGSAGADANLPTYIQELEAQLATDSVEDNTDIDYTDYAYYEYFNYADLRTEARNLVKTYYAPEVMDNYYILNSGIREAELNNVIAAETNEVIVAAIEATKLANDPAAIAASIVVREGWKQPVHTELYIDDFTARLAYYKQFLDANKENDDHLQFLAKEIDHVEAQQFVAADYTEASWQAYADALAAAKDMESKAEDGLEKNSDIFQAKWDLMVARKNLLKKTDSLIEAGGTATLNANIIKAEEILAMNYDEIELSEKGLDLGDDLDDEGNVVKTAKDKALGHLLQGLGYYYTGEDGNEWNLYADSAYEYADNDRHKRQSNQNKVDRCNTNLDACIAYFAVESEPNTLVLNENAPFEAIIDTVNCGEYNGAIYGFDTLGWNDDFTVDGTIADFVTTAYGDEYLEVVVGDAGVETTGTLINVLDEEGNAVETYVFIYFGDMDMDGAVGFSDASMADYYEMNYIGIDTLYQFMSGDIDSDTIPGFSDASTMDYWEMNYMGMPFQVDVGATASGLEYIIY